MQSIKYLFLLVFGCMIGIAVNSGGTEQNQKPLCPVCPVPQQTANTEEVNMMARALYSETKSMEAYEYIAWVIRNRVKDPRYPNTVKGVVLDPGQFSAFNSLSKRRELMQLTYGDTRRTAFRRAYRMAEYVLNAPRSKNPLPTVTHFYMQETLRDLYGKDAPHWATKDPVYVHGQIHFHSPNS